MTKRDLSVTFLVAASIILAAALLSGCKTANPHPPQSPAWYQHEQLEEAKRYRRQRWVGRCQTGRC